MRVCRCLLALALASFCALPLLGSSLLAAPPQPGQTSDEDVAQSVLGPQWKQFSRRAGIIFAGTVLAAPALGPRFQTSALDRQSIANASTIPSTIPLSFRVDRAIAGTEAGQVLTIHEWVGALSRHNPMIPGQRLLLFFYPPSRLGLTSPVGGSLGQIPLDATGTKVTPLKSEPVTLDQLERAVRAAREE